MPKLGFAKRDLDDMVKHYLDIDSLDAALLLYLFSIVCIRYQRVSEEQLHRLCQRAGLNVSRARIRDLFCRWKMHRYVTSIVHGYYTLGPNLVVTNGTLDRARKLLIEKLGEDKVRAIEEAVKEIERSCNTSQQATNR